MNPIYFLMHIPCLIVNDLSVHAIPNLKISKSVNLNNQYYLI